MRIPSRQEALLLLKDFIPRAGQHYAQNRNFDEGPSHRRNVSGLSPYLRRRILTEAEVLNQVFQFHSVQSVEKFVQEVVWRTYWKGWLEMRPEVWSRYQKKRHELQHLKNNESYQSAVRGKTGIECFDFWTQELLNTGYLHNHARLWFASLWIYGLGLPWELGAEFFYRHLLDGDPASNTLSWRWVAGLQTSGKKYLASSSNIEKFSNFTNVKIPELKKLESTENPEMIPHQKLSMNPPAHWRKIKNLLIHSEDLSPEISELQDLDFKQIFSISFEALGLQSEFDAKVIHFDEQTLEEASQRAQKHFGVSVNRLSRLEELGSEPILCLGVPQGLVREKLKPSLNVHFAWRDWDSEFYPLAKSGFFNFKKSLQNLDLKIFCARQTKTTD